MTDMAEPPEDVATTAPATRVGVPRETAPGERRVALVPAVISRLQSMGLAVVVEAGAGEGAQIADVAYERAGATIGDPWDADVVVKVNPPSAAEVELLGSGSVLLGFLAPLARPAVAESLRAAGVTAFALESVPRISRAQSMDALSSQANVAGYKAVIAAAEHSTRFFPMLTTAAGTVKPAAALRLGARTTGFDVRPEVAEQVKSLGAQWLDLGVTASGEGGYARSLTGDEQAAQQAALTEAIARFDVVITTALVPGRPAPKLVTAEAVRSMRPGSVVVDLAGETSGNCEVSVPGSVVVVDGVTIAAPLNLPATMPEHASELYARNVLALLELMVVDGKVAPDFSDEIIAKSCVTRVSGPESGSGPGSESGSESELEEKEA
jgi:NAD(P) transhydrogenase subunit alpha